MKRGKQHEEKANLAKGGANQSRRFGFKENREQYELRKKEEKQSKWSEKLSRENVDKLREELDSLGRARFLAPQQNERKRLVQRMIKDLEAKNEKAVVEDAPAVKAVPAPVPDSDSDDDLIFSRGAACNDEDKRLFIPRSLRRKNEEEKPEAEEEIPQTVEEAEKELLAAGEGEDDMDAFLDTLY